MSESSRWLLCSDDARSVRRVEMSPNHANATDGAPASSRLEAGAPLAKGRIARRSFCIALLVLLHQPRDRLVVGIGRCVQRLNHAFAPFGRVILVQFKLAFQFGDFKAEADH